MTWVSYNAWRDGGQLAWIELLLPSGLALKLSIVTRIAIEVGVSVLLAVITYLALRHSGVGSPSSALVDTHALRMSIALPLYLLLMRPQFELFRRIAFGWPGRFRLWLLFAAILHAASLWLSFVFPKYAIEVFAHASDSNFGAQEERTLLFVLFIVWIATIRGVRGDIKSAASIQRSCGE